MDEIGDEAARVAVTVAATDAASMQRIEIVGERRRAHDAAFRARVVAECMVPGTRVQELARRHGICTSLIYRWRRVATPQAGAASAVRLVPVRVSEPRPAEKQAAPARPAGEARRSGLIEIELSGGVRVRVDGEVSLAALRRVMTALRG
jgi:transposase